MLVILGSNFERVDVHVSVIRIFNFAYMCTNGKPTLIVSARSPKII